MKFGKYKKLEVYENVKIGYGTVDYSNFKSVYLKLNSWLLPNIIDINYNEIIHKNKRRIKLFISDNENDFFKRENIVDLDISIKGLKKNKKSFMNLEITLFVKNENVIFKDKNLKKFINNISKDIIDILREDEYLFNFNLTK